MIKKLNKKTLIIAALVLAIVLIGGTSAYAGYIYRINENWDNLIYPGTKIASLDVGGKTKEEAVELIKAEYGDKILQKKTNIKTPDKTYTLDYSKLNAHYNIEDTVNEALQNGKDLNLFNKNSLINNGTGDNFELKFVSENTYVDELVAQVQKETDRNAEDAKIEMVSSGSFNVTPDKKGYKVKTEELKKVIEESINGDLQANKEIEVPAEETTANITADKLSSINEKISTYNTDYKTSTTERITNIQLATSSINGKVLFPGESFSFNGIVGERTRARGYKEAGAIINNKIEQELGGGICQVSSTLYNAVLKTGISSTERFHHTFPSSYVPKGLDATVDWGNLDYKFTNTLEYPIYIEGINNNKKLTFNIYSNSSLNTKKYEVVGNVVETISSTNVSKEDNTLPVGETVTDQKAYTGYRVNVIRVTYENGQKVNEETLYKDYYKPINGVVRVGTKTQ